MGVAATRRRSVLVAARTLPPHAEQPVFVIGGNGMYAEAMALADDLYLTEIEAEVPGDAYFPQWDRTAFREVSRDRQTGTLVADAAPVPYSFVHYERVA